MPLVAAEEEASFTTFIPGISAARGVGLAHAEVQH